MLNLNERNLAGETASSLAQEKKNDKILKLLEWCQQHLGDQTKQQTDALLNDLLAEEQKEEQKKAKKKEKKQRQKIRQIADKEGVSVDDVQKKFEEDKIQKRLDEEQKKRDDDERERREQDEEKKQLEDRARALQSAATEEEQKRVKAAKFAKNHDS